MSTPTATVPPGIPGAPGGAPGHLNHVISALATFFQKQNGGLQGTMTDERVAELLNSNLMRFSDLAKSGRIPPEQLRDLKNWASNTTARIQQERAAAGGTATQVSSQTAIAGPSRPTALPTVGPTPGMYKSGEAFIGQPAAAPAVALPALGTTDPGPVPWSAFQQIRPTLTGGIAFGRMSGTPSQFTRQPDDPSTLNIEDTTRTRKKSTAADQSLRKTIQDLVASVDPTVKIDADVEDLLLNVADEFIDSVTNFGCRLAKHRGGDTLEVRDIQLHLERNHNIRIPGFTTDESRISLSQASIAPVMTQAAPKKPTTGGSATSSRSARLAQVQQAKRDAKLI